MINLKRLVRHVLRSRGWEFRHFDPDLRIDTYLWAYLEPLGVNCVIDVGGRHGEFARTLREGNYRGHIISFEPVSENFKRLQHCARRDRFWHVYPYALGRESGSAEINVAAASNFSSFLTPNDKAASELLGYSLPVRREQVTVRRLDEIFDEVTAHIPAPHVYLKIDTQGWDLEVFAGSEGCLEKVVALQAELSLQPIYNAMPGWQQAIGAFEEAGFYPSAFFTVARDTSLRLVEVDGVFVRAKADRD